MSEREQFESAIREAFQIGKASANEQIAFSSTAIALEELIARTRRQAIAASPKVPQGVIVPVEVVEAAMVLIRQLTMSGRADKIVMAREVFAALNATKEQS